MKDIKEKVRQQLISGDYFFGKKTIDKEKPEKGEVVAIGNGKLLDNGQKAPLTVKVGDKVMFKKYSPDEVKIDGVEYLIISEGDILAILE